MALFTADQALSCVIERAFFITDWRISIKDEDGNGYLLIILDGDSTDTNPMLQAAVYDELLLIEKKAAPVIPTVTEPMDIRGLNPAP